MATSPVSNSARFSTGPLQGETSTGNSSPRGSAFPPGPPGLSSRPVPAERTPSARLAEADDARARPGVSMQDELAIGNIGGHRLSPLDPRATSALLTSALRSESRDHADPSTSAAHQHVVDTPRLSPQDEVRANLIRFDFAAPPGPGRAAQEALENRYVDWVAAQVVEPRRRAFG